MSMILNQAIVFDDETLLSLEGILHSKFVGDNIKSQIRKACQDYRLLKRYLPAKGLTKQVVFFLLDPISTTSQGIQSFFEKLLVWVEILPEYEQQVYQDLVLEYYEPPNRLQGGNDWSEEDISQVRDNLMSVMLELHPRIDTKTPMQLHKDYGDYSSFMMNYGSEFDKPDSVFNKVPNDSFSSYLEMIEKLK